MYRISYSRMGWNGSRDTLPEIPDFPLDISNINQTLF